MTTPPRAISGYRAELERCVACGKCRALCPVFEIVRSETASPRGKLKILAAVEDGLLPRDGGLSRIIDDCLGCGRCTRGCPLELPTDRLVRTARSRLLKRRGPSPAAVVHRLLSPRPALGRTLTRLSASVGRALRLSRPARYLADLPPGHGLDVQAEPFNARGTLSRDPAGARRLGLFLGCLAPLSHPRALWSIVETARRLGLTLICPPGQVCCGGRSLCAGDRRGLEIARRVNSAVFDDAGVDGVVTACACCSVHLRDSYGGVLGQTLSFGEFAARHSVELPLPATTERRLAWLPPCRLAKTGSDDTLTLLRRLSRCHELPEGDICCGGPPGYAGRNPAIAAALVGRKASLVTASEAELVVVDCPRCAVQLQSALRADHEVEVRLLPEVLVPTQAGRAAGPGLADPPVV